MVLLGGIEGGGTTFVLSVARDTPLNIIETFELTTGGPQETIDALVEWFSSYSLDALGIAMFGPLDLNEKSKTFGYIKNTPKEKWRNFDMLGTLRQKFPRVPMTIQSDVNAAALAEVKLGFNGDITSCAYITVGTGVGVGICIDSQPLVGFSHPEGGHIRVPLHASDVATNFEGCCPFHGSCVEGLSNAASIAARKGCLTAQLPHVGDFDPVWQIAGSYLGELCAQLTLLCSPEVIVVGGGVFQRECLLEETQKSCVSSLAGYLPLPKPIENYIVLSSLTDGPGVVGSLQLALQAHSMQ